MQVPRAETMAVKAETPRSGLLPQHMAAVVVAVVKVLLHRLLAVLEVASGQKVHRPVVRERTALVAGALVLQQQV